MTFGRMLMAISGGVGASGGAIAAMAARAGADVSALAPGWIAVGALLGAVCGLAAGVPVGLLVDRRLDDLCRGLMNGPGEGEPDEKPLPKWLSGLAGAIDESRERLATEAAKASSKLRELELRWRVSETEHKRIESTLDSLRDSVVVTDAFDELTIANETAARLLGFDRAACQHKRIDDVIADEMLCRLIRQAREAGSLTDRKTIEYDMAGVEGEGGKARSFDITLACLPDHRPDTVGGVVTILRDVTREREISQMKSDFVSQVSHELRTPLASINAYVEMLVDGEAKDEAARTEFYQIIKNEADRLGRLIDNMLNISRIEAGIVQVERSEVDFVEVLREVVEVMQPQARLKDITLIFKPGPLVYTAKASRDMMHQVALNLVSNAVKYTPEGGRVTVSAENDDASRSVLVTVADTGLGIPPDALDKVFDKFYRIENYKRVAKGTGLGLNLVKHIVETVHAGQVGVQSTVGMGSKFWFTIPFDNAGRAAA